MHLIKHKRRLFNLVLHAHFIDILLFMLAKTHRTVTYAGGVNCSVIKGIVFRFEASFTEVLKTDIIFPKLHDCPESSRYNLLFSCFHFYNKITFCVLSDFLCFWIMMNNNFFDYVCHRNGIDRVSIWWLKIASRRCIYAPIELIGTKSL